MKELRITKNVEKNYTEAQELAIREAGLANGGTFNGDMASSLVETVGKPKRSIVAKMSTIARMESETFSYERKVAVSKDGSTIRKKSDIVADIAATVGLTLADVDTLAKASKSQLEALSEAVNA